MLSWLEKGRTICQILKKARRQGETTTPTGSHSKVHYWRDPARTTNMAPILTTPAALQPGDEWVALLLVSTVVALLLHSQTRQRPPNHESKNNENENESDIESQRQRQDHSPSPPLGQPEDGWAANIVAGLPEMWTLIAEHSDFVEAWRLMGVCRASRVGVREHLQTLPGMVVSGGVTTSSTAGCDREVSEVWRLDPATLRWESMPALTCARYSHSCCAVTVRGEVNLVAIGGEAPFKKVTNFTRISREAKLGFRV